MTFRRKDYVPPPEILACERAIEAVRKAKVVPIDFDADVYSFSPKRIARSSVDFPVVLPGHKFWHWISRSFLPVAFVREFADDVIFRFERHLHKLLYTFPGLSTSSRDRFSFDFLCLLMICLVERCSLDRKLKLSPRKIVFAIVPSLISYNPAFSVYYLECFNEAHGWFLPSFCSGCSLSQRLRTFARTYFNDYKSRLDFLYAFTKSSYLVIRSCPEIDAVLEQLHKPINPFYL